MGITTEWLLIILCGIVILSYGFSLLSRQIRVPSVLLLLFTGIAARIITDNYGLKIQLPETLVEGLGVVGLIIIVLEAGLDLKLEKSKLPLIRSSFLTALLILIFSAAAITCLLYYWLQEDLTTCIVYALPLSIMSSSIVLPSIHALSADKKEFLVYEASFSDILGIMLFNYFVAKEIFTLKSVGLFGLSFIAAGAASLVVSFFLFLLLTKINMQIKFFLVFALLVFIYSGGKMLHIPSLLIILVFGLMINNWEQVPIKSLQKRFTREEIEPVRHLLHSITAETSFLIRTFFFMLFGYSIDVSLLQNEEVIIIGSLIVVILFVVRWLYLKFAFKTKVFPEVFFIPRGLITIVLFYKIPPQLKLESFNDGILFFVILSTGVILSVGMIFYRKKEVEIVEDPQFSPQG